VLLPAGHYQLSTGISPPGSISVGDDVEIVGAANASATIDLIWVDMTDTACTDAGRRDCPRLGSTISSVAVTDSITLGVIWDMSDHR